MIISIEYCLYKKTNKNMGSKMSNHVIPKRDIIEEDEVDVCPICYDPLTENNSECVQKWNCSHRFHTKCIQNWNNGCPLCRTTQLRTQYNTRRNSCCSNTSKINPVNILDINIMKTSIKHVPEEHKSIYKNEWKDRCCIRENHNILFVQPYGVLGICEVCNIIQCYNVKH